MKQTFKETGGTSFHGVVINASVNQLKAILGTPHYAGNDGRDKVNFEWEMETSSGAVFTVYDWKEYRIIDEDEMIEWHIGGFDKMSTLIAKEEIEKAL